MNAEEEVLAAQSRKFAAMVARDVGELGELLDERLSYVHSSGLLDTKESFLKSVAERGYVALTRKEADVRLYGDNFAVVTGLADMHVTEALRFDARFTEIWVRDGSWRAIAWQSTRLP